MRKKKRHALNEIISGFTGEIKTFFSLFKKESVFKYLLLILFLQILSSVFFICLEYDRVLAANPSKPVLSFFDKTVTVLYWAIITITTVGYGDLTPLSNAGRITVMVTVYLSLGAVSLFTANLASALTTKKLMERRGIMDLSDIKDHFIICGWKLSMAKILKEITTNNPGLNLKKIIIIAAIEPDAIELFKQQYPEFQDILIIRGEHYSESLLRKANVLKAAKVLILADESGSSSSTEVDAKTVMTAMTIHSISISIKVCAELLDVKFEKYLKSAHVEDIIFTNEYSKVLIANSFTQVGITKVVNDLLDVHSPAFLKTEEIPEAYYGKKFMELKEHFKTSGNAICIGLLENVGGYLERKDEAIREAQKTADVLKLISNLKMAKKMENNLPHISPDDHYPVPSNSMAILVGRRNV